MHFWLIAEMVAFKGVLWEVPEQIEREYLAIDCQSPANIYIITAVLPVVGIILHKEADFGIGWWQRKS